MRSAIFLLLTIVSIILLGLVVNQSGGIGNNKYDKAIESLVKQCARWSTAAEQDNNPLIANLHANYGAGYLFALEDISSDREVERITGIDFEKFRSEILRIQDQSARGLIKKCPEAAPAASFLAKIGGES